MSNLRKMPVTEYYPIHCPVLKKDIDPVECYENRMGMNNIFESVGIFGDESWKTCQRTCDRIPKSKVMKTRYVLIDERGKLVCDCDE